MAIGGGRSGGQTEEEAKEEGLQLRRGWSREGHFWAKACWKWGREFSICVS